MSEGAREILLAEDEEHIAKLICFKLTKEGWNVTLARNGQEALDRLADKPWRLLILDVMMPLKTGWEVLQALRADPRFAGLPVLVLTAKGFQKDLTDAAAFGATAYLKKPFDPNDLAATVKRLAG